MIARLKLYAIAAGVFVAALLAAYFAGDSKGAASAKAKQAEADRHAATKAKGVADAVDNLGASDVSARLDKWMRD
jgi:hypothetical protein